MTHEERLAAALLAAANDWERAMGKDVFWSFLDFLQDKAAEQKLDPPVKKAERGVYDMA